MAAKSQYCFFINCTMRYSQYYCRHKINRLFSPPGVSLTAEVTVIEKLKSTNRNSKWKHQGMKTESIIDISIK